MNQAEGHACSIVASHTYTEVPDAACKKNMSTRNSPWFY